MIALLIPVEGPLEEVVLDGGLEQLQEIVGGMIQALPLPPFITNADRATAYINEEGKLIDLAVNYRATDFMVPGAGMMPGDYIVGPFLLCGFDPMTGTHRELPHAVVRRARLIEDEAAA